MNIETKFFISLPICKVDKEKRTIEGYATTDSIDKQNEQVDYDASKEAFKDWSGNLREMHEPVAVGKAISWEPDDAKRGIKVKAYVSKGAQATWEKILDGTLKAFSIGGQTVNKTQQIIKDESTGGQRHVTKITKYRLTELSLVDNPANPDATFELVKMANGVPTQTEIVEDVKKFLVCETADTLAKEVEEHRNKADALAKKVLSSDELEKLDSEQWGVVRKYEKEGTQYIERILPMLDKVHAVRALAVMDSYSLTQPEQDRVHDMAKSILGSDYEIYALSTTKGGEIKKMNREILDALKALTKRIDTLEQTISKANMETDSNLKTQEEKVGAPNNSAPVKESNSEGKVPVEGEKQVLTDNISEPANPDQMPTQEEGNVAPVKKELQKPIDPTIEGEKVDTLKPVEKAADPATSNLKTQEEGNVAPVKKELMTPIKPHIEGDKVDTLKPIEKAKNPATSNLHTMSDKDVPPVKKGELPDVGAKKAVPDLKTQEEGNVAPVKKAKNPATSDLETMGAEDTPPVKRVRKSLDSAEAPASDEALLKEIQTLRKRIDEIESKPLPRKYRVLEKSFGPSEKSTDDGLAADMQKCLELRKSEQNGKRLTADEIAFCQKTAQKSIDFKIN